MEKIDPIKKKELVEQFCEYEMLTKLLIAKCKEFTFNLDNQKKQEIEGYKKEMDLLNKNIRNILEK